MKKTLSIILSLVLVLSLCSSAFAADNNLKMTYSTDIVNGNRVNTFQYRDTEGRLVREEVDTLGNNGQLLEKHVAFFNEEGQKLSERIAGFEDNGVWKDDEAVWTYHSDGSQVVDSRTVYINPDNTQKFERLQITVDADGQSKGRGEVRDASGNKLYDLAVDYSASESGNVDEVKYIYPSGSVSTESSRKNSDGTVINETIVENAQGQVVKMTSYQQNPDDSYVNQSTSIRYQDNGSRFISESLDTMDKDGYRETSKYSYTLNENGFGSGRGVYTDGTGRSAIMDIEYRDDGEEGKVCVTAYRFSNGQVDIKYDVTAPDGKVTTTYEADVKNYDGGDDDEDFDTLLNEEEDSFDVWDEVFSDEYEESYSGDPAAFEGDGDPNYYETDVDSGDESDVQYEESYPGDPAALEDDGDINYYDTDVTWSDASDWGDASDWSPDWNDYGDYGSLDDAAGWD